MLLSGGSVPMRKDYYILKDIINFKGEFFYKHLFVTKEWENVFMEFVPSYEGTKV
jgi:hypothetical protein